MRDTSFNITPTECILSMTLGPRTASRITVVQREVEKGKKALADAIMAQVNDIAEDIDVTNKKIDELEQTPKKRTVILFSS